MMKRTLILLVFVFVTGWTFFPLIVQADMEWKNCQRLRSKNYLDIASSADGKWLLFLTPGEIVEYFPFRKG